MIRRFGYLASIRLGRSTCQTLLAMKWDAARTVFFLGSDTLSNSMKANKGVYT